MKINSINQINFKKKFCNLYNTDTGNQKSKYYVYKISPNYDYDYIDELIKSDTWNNSEDVKEALLWENFLYKASAGNLSGNTHSTYAVENNNFQCVGITHVIERFTDKVKEIMLVVNPDLSDNDKITVKEIIKDFLKIE